MFDENWALLEATKIASESPCQSKRGVIIWHREHGIVSGGYNNQPSGFSCDGSEKCRCNCAKTAVHAEQAALIKAISVEKRFSLSECEMLHVKSVEGNAVFSEKPRCWQCSKLILEAGLDKMWLYLESGLKSYSAEDFHKITLENNDLL